MATPPWLAAISLEWVRVRALIGFLKKELWDAKLHNVKFIPSVRAPPFISAVFLQTFTAITDTGRMEQYRWQP